MFEPLTLAIILLKGLDLLFRLMLMYFSLYIDIFDPFVDFFNTTKSLLLDDSLAPLHITRPHASIHEFLL